MKMPKQAKPVQRKANGGAPKRSQVKLSDACCGNGTCAGACITIPFVGSYCAGVCV